MDEERSQSNPPANNQQNYTINKQILYDDDEFNVNIEDVDLQVKLWSKLISSFLDLMKGLMAHKTVNSVMKAQIQKKEKDQISETIVQTRNKVIFKFFE